MCEPPGNQSFWVPGEVWLQTSWRVEDRETAAAPYIRGECVVPCYYRANTGLPRHMLVACVLGELWHSVSGRTYCDDDLAGLLSPSRQPSVADVSTGGRKSLLVEAIYFG